MKTKAFWLISFAISVALIFVIYLLNRESVPSPKIENLANEQFIFQMGAEVAMDQDLSVEIFDINSNFGNLYPTDMTFMVANLSNEAIVFPDTYYGVKVYEWDSQTNKWIIVEMNFSLFQLQSILPPGDTSKIAPRNGFTLFGDDFVDTDLSLIRVYISGKGATSGKQYGDYIDVTLNEP